MAACTLVTGPSSTIFWCRRCTLQSLENKETTFPNLHCISYSQRNATPDNIDSACLSLQGMVEGDRMQEDVLLMTY